MGESAGEHLAVVGEDLLRHPVAGQAFEEGLAHGARRGSMDERGDDAEPRVVVDPGDHLALGAVLEEHPTHHVHLPQLHGPRPLPALVVLEPSSSGLGLDEPVPDEAAVDRRAGGGLVQLPAQLGQDGPRAPPRM